MKKILSSLLLMVCSVMVHAQGVSAPSSFDRFMWSVTGGSSQTVGFGAGGQPIVTGAPPMIDTDGGLPRVSTSGTLTNPAGKPVPIAATGRISALQTAKAVGRVLAAVSGPVFIAASLLEVAKELNFSLSKNPDGSVALTKSGTVATGCYGIYPGPWGGTPFCGTREQAMKVDLSNQNHTDLSVWINCTATTCTYSPNGNVLFSNPVVISESYESTPSSTQEFLDAVATKSGWPSTSNISKVLSEPAAGATEKIQTEPLTVTGPATSPGAVKLTTKTLPDGTVETTTETATYKHEYLGPDITTTASTTTIVQTCTGAGSCSQTSSSTTTQPTDPAPDGTATDTAFADLPQLYKPKYADGLEGVWAAKSAALKASPLLSLVNQLMPNIGVGGACPSWMLNLDIGPWAYGSHDVAPPCYIWDVAKVFVVIGALLLARALVFGG